MNPENSKIRHVPLSSEEVDILNRNKKKVKNKGEDFTGQSSSPISYADLEDLDGVDENNERQPQSFKESLTGIRLNVETELVDEETIENASKDDEDMPPLEDAAPVENGNAKSNIIVDGGFTYVH